MTEFTLKDIQGKGLLYPLEKGIPYRFTFPDILNSSFLTIEGDVSLEGEIQPILNIAGIGGNKGKEYGVVLPSGGNIFIFLPNVSSNARIRGGGIQSFTLGNLYIEEFLIRVDNDGGVTESVECLESSIIDIGGENFNSASLVITSNAYKAGKLYSLKPFDGSGDFDVVRATTAWRRNSSGVWESVANNVPRLHYPVGGGCPSVLVEPQRTNLAIHFAQIEDYGTNLTPPTLLSTTEPFGNFGNVGRRYEFTNVNGWINVPISVVQNTNYTFSIFVRPETLTNLRVIFASTEGSFSTSGFNVDLTNLTPSSPEYEGNGVYRLSVTTLHIGVNADRVLRISNLSGSGIATIYGVQIEEGTEATSIIPTTSATVTRNADIIDVTTPAGVTEIVETFADGSINTETTIPATYQIPQGEIKSIVMT
jgi:hypothetical protein